MKPKITIAKTAGFCFGVNRAVKTVERLLNEGKRVCTLGEIIHNSHVVDSLAKRGVKVVNAVSEVQEGYTLVIRSHGCTKEDMSFVVEHGIPYVDATCPFVKRIHKIVEENRDNRKVLLAAGNANHPEMIGIRSYFDGKSYVFSSRSELEEIIEKEGLSKDFSIMVISQTTFSREIWEECIKFIKKHFTNTTIHDTICNTTNLRQIEAEKMSKTSDLMIVVGGYKSSNTRKLYDICRKYAESILIEGAEELELSFGKNYERIGIVAGASTPIELVEEIKNRLERIIYGMERRKIGEHQV